MTENCPDRALDEPRSLVTSGGTLQLSLHEVPVRRPGDNEVLVRIEASPINPSDLGLLVAGADMSEATVSGTPQRPVVTAPIEAPHALTARLDQSRYCEDVAPPAIPTVFPMRACAAGHSALVHTAAAHGFRHSEGG